MTKVLWDQTGERRFEQGVDRGVLYIPNNGVYDMGYAWNGLTGVTEAPSGAEASSVYADNIKYLSLVAAEEFGGTIEAFTYPDQFGQCDGTAAPATGLTIGQQARKPFGFSYRTLVGNDVAGSELGYKIHLVYGALAAPSEKPYSTVNDSPEAVGFSWTFTTSPVGVTGYKPTAILTIDSTKVSASALTNIENAIYGTVGTEPRLPLPDEIIAIITAGAGTMATATQPTFVAAGGTITIPTVTGVVYRRTDTNAVVAAGSLVVPTPGGTLGVRAYPATGAYFLDPVKDNFWTFTRTT